MRLAFFVDQITGAIDEGFADALVEAKHYASH
jgi:hypothetical protein